jgi:polysaccharide export outer membrane protein
MRLKCIFIFTLGAAAALAQPGRRNPTTTTAGERGPYQIVAGDTLQITIEGEADLSGERKTDEGGNVFLPLVGSIKLAGLTVDEAKAAIAKKYVDEQMLLHPDVAVNVTTFAPREILILGQVGKPSKIEIPPGKMTISIVDAITSVGGFTRIGKSEGVRVTRKEADGTDHSYTLDVQKMIEGKTAGADIFMLQPGDVVFVPERVF